MTIQNNKQSPLSRMADVLDDFLPSILKAIIVMLVADIIYKYAKKELRYVLPYLNKFRFSSGFVMHLFATKLKIESSEAFIVAIITLAYKTATDEQKITIRQLLSAEFANLEYIR